MNEWLTPSEAAAFLGQDPKGKVRFYARGLEIRYKRDDIVEYAARMANPDNSEGWEAVEPEAATQPAASNEPSAVERALADQQNEDEFKSSIPEPPPPLFDANGKRLNSSLAVNSRGPIQFVDDQGTDWGEKPDPFDGWPKHLIAGVDDTPASVKAEGDRGAKRQGTDEGGDPRIAELEAEVARLRARQGEAGVG